MSTMLEVLPPLPTRPLKRMMSMRDLWDVHVSIKGELAPSTLMYRKAVGDMFCKFMEGRSLEPETMVEYLNHLRSTSEGGHNHINKNLTAVRGFLKFLKTMKYIRDDLWDALPNLPPQPVAEVQTFTSEEYETIKAYCKGREWCQPHLWLIILGYRTGMSLVDCCHLRWRDVHLNDNGPSFIRIHRIKTKRLGEKSLCQIPIMPLSDIHEWLLNLKKVEHLNYRRSDGITDFVHQDCPGLYCYASSRIGNDFKNIFIRAGLGRGKTFRHFRSTFCSNLVNSKAQIALICKMSGHNSVTMLLRYLKADMRSLQDALAQSFQFASAGNIEMQNGL